MLSLKEFFRREGAAVREGPEIEFKEDVTNTFLKTVSAYANYNGGRGIFGVDDSGEAKGLADAEAACLSIENRINDSISPAPDYFLKINPDETVTLTVEPGADKPYLYKSKAYRRHDTATVEVDPLELKRLILQGSNLTYDAVSADVQELKFEVLERYLKREANLEAFNHDTLRTLNLYSDRDGYNNAAAILADENDFPGIDIARFGESISIIQKRETIKNVSALEAYEKAVGIYRDYYVYEVVDGISRRKEALIPEEAFREAAANALIHRQWDVDAQIRISMFEDRIEVVSPGGLPAGISESDYLKGNLSLLRNPILANVFFRLKLVEIFGTGITRIKESYKSSAKKPKFEISDSAIKVSLPVFEDNIGLSEDEKNVYGALSKVMPKSIGEIAPGTGFGRSKVGKLLKDLLEKEVIVQEGVGRGTKYRIR